jgi:ABC-type glycerol-3-phosphate transport system substrate-binding protein
MNMRPFQIIVIAVFVLGALLGLYFFSTFDQQASTGVEIGTVTVWGTIPSKSMNDMLLVLADTDKRFETVSYREVNERTFNRDFADAISTGNGPDLILVSQELVLSNVNRINVIPFTSITERTYRDTYLPFFDVFRTETGFYGIPFALDPLVLYYNTAHLSSAGYALPASTWEGVLGQAPTLTQIATDQSLVRSAVAFGEYDNVANARSILSLLLLQTGVSISANVGGSYRSTLVVDPTNEARGSAPSESAINFYTQFANPSKTVYSWNRSLKEARQAFIAGDLTYYIGFASEHTALTSANPNLPFDMASIPQPGSNPDRISFGKGYVFALPISSGNSTGAYYVADILSRSVPTDTYIGDLRMAPAVRTLLVAPENDPYAPIYFREALFTRGWLSPTPEETDSIFSAMISNIGSGRKDVTDALNTADQTLNQALR